MAAVVLAMASFVGFDRLGHVESAIQLVVMSSNFAGKGLGV
jgi:hypothetical protein